MHTSARISLCLLCALLLNTKLEAQIVSTWTGAGDGISWNDPNNWNPPIVPDSSFSPNRFIVNIDSNPPMPSMVEIVGINPIIDALNLDNNDVLVITDNHFLNLDAGFGGGIIQNDGQLLLDSIFGPTGMQIQGGSVTLQGNGVFDLSDSIDNIIMGGNPLNDRLIHQANHSIVGAGQIGNMKLTNNGTITANRTSPMIIGLAGTVVDNLNTGTLQAVNGSALEIVQTQIDNNNGLIHANNGNVVLLDTTVANGELRVDGAGGQLILDGSTIDGGVINNANFIPVVLNSTLKGGNLNNQATGIVQIDDNQTLTLDTGTYQ